MARERNVLSMDMSEYHLALMSRLRVALYETQTFNELPNKTEMIRYALEQLAHMCLRADEMALFQWDDGGRLVGLREQPSDGKGGAGR